MRNFLPVVVALLPLQGLMSTGATPQTRAELDSELLKQGWKLNMWREIVPPQTRYEFLQSKQFSDCMSQCLTEPSNGGFRYSPWPLKGGSFTGLGKLPGSELFGSKSGIEPLPPTTEDSGFPGVFGSKSPRITSPEGGVRVVYSCPPGHVCIDSNKLKSAIDAKTVCEEVLLFLFDTIEDIKLENCDKGVSDKNETVQVSVRDESQVSNRRYKIKVEGRNKNLVFKADPNRIEQIEFDFFISLDFFGNRQGRLHPIDYLYASSSSKKSEVLTKWNVMLVDDFGRLKEISLTLQNRLVKRLFARTER